MSAITILGWGDTVEIADRIQAGEVGLIPTDTVYGLAASPSDQNATARIFELKKRPGARPLPLLLSDQSALTALDVDVTPVAERLLRSPFMPGALTLALGFSEAPRVAWLKGRAEVALRIPDERPLRDVLARTGPICATSANAHGEPTPELPKDILPQLAGTPDFVVEDGPRPTVPSTLVNCAVTPPRIERVGAVSEADLAEYLATDPGEDLS
ncbi:MAG: L-threonylcarbamoyladenylate synthase [Pseudomonadota bacterium]